MPPTLVDSSPEARRRRLARFLPTTEEGDGAREQHDAQHKGAAAERLLQQVSAAVQLKQKARSSQAQALTREQRIIKACWTMAPHADDTDKAKADAALAVDILTASLTKVLSEPDNERYRKVNVSAAGPFRDRVATRAGSTELLYSIGYTPMFGHLVLQSHEPALIQHALDCLHAAQESREYQAAKAARLDAHAAAKKHAQEAAAAKEQRAAHLAAVPPAPSSESGGASTSACVITIYVDGVRCAQRRFESDNTLTDLAHYVRSLPEVPVDAQVRIENVTTRPHQRLDPEDQLQRNASLYALDLWPISHVGVVIEAAA